MWSLLPLMLVLAFVLRAVIALSGDFVLHPDEIMQYLEPAHGLVFGNSVQYWEWFYGARSWLVPGLIAGVLWACSLIGLDTPYFYIAAVKLFFCALSLLIPWGMYVFCRRHWSEHSARLALILGVFWYEFAAFAHKPMTEFVASALVITLLALMPLHAQTRNWRGLALLAAVGVLAVAVRFQYAPVIGVILLIVFFRAHNWGRLAMLAGGVAVLVAVGALEFFTWDAPFHSYYWNAKFNLVINVRRLSESSTWLVPWWLLHASGGLLAVAMLGALWRRHQFVLGLLVLVVVLHMLPNHREYRFIFVALPLWLMLFADLAVVISAHLKIRLMTGAAMTLAAAVSTAGIFNVIPFQEKIYTGFSGETGKVNFLRNQDSMFPAYRHLSEDDSVRGVIDSSRPYLNTGGYYYLHHTIPFYTHYTWQQVGQGHDAAPYASHIITKPSVAGDLVIDIKDKAGRQKYKALKTTNGNERIPIFIGDADSGQLVYWSANGERHPQANYVATEQFGELVIWRNTSGQPVKRWRHYRVTSTADFEDTLKSVFDRAPPTRYGIEFVTSDE